MSNLQTLHVKCKNIKDSKQISSVMNNDQFSDAFSDTSDDTVTAKRDELIQWLYNHLPSMSLISQDPYSLNRVQIWI